MLSKDRPNPPLSNWFVYIVRCADASLYTGIAKDVMRRCRQHNAGTASKYTRSRRPIRVVYQEIHASQSSALKREAAIKAMPRQRKLALIRKRPKALRVNAP
jgi:predicted GIY-YIG superfamily endonuclease